jgi:hypothetical protein
MLYWVKHYEVLWAVAAVLTSHAPMKPMALFYEFSHILYFIIVFIIAGLVHCLCSRFQALSL